MKFTRQIHTTAAIFSMMLALCAGASANASAQTTPAPAAKSGSASGWAQMDVILARIKAPEFPAKDFVITDYGAKAGGVENARPAILAAMDACVKAGGGRVVIPAGVFLCNGPIHLKSGVNLNIAENATLKFGTNPQDYLPVVLTRWEGILVYNYSPLIYARGEKNIAITGKGSIDGSGKEGFYAAFVKHQEADRNALWRMGAAKVPPEKRIFGDSHYLRPGGIEPFECENVLIEGVAVTNMPFWCVHPIFCKNVTVDGIRVDSTTGNNDGCDPESCIDVLIQNCFFRTGDDSIAIKSGRDQDAWTVGKPCENVVIRKCVANGKLYGYAIGSEMSGDVRNVFIEDCSVLSGRAGIYTKANLNRGGIVENVWVRRVKIGKMSEAAIRFEANYHGLREGDHHPPLFRDFVIEDVTCEATNNYGIYIEGQPETPVTNVLLRNITIGPVKKPFWIHHIKNVTLENVTIDGHPAPSTPPLTPADEEKFNIRD